MINDPLTVIGGGPAGLAAAAAAVDAGCGRVLLIERDRELGGILNQCVHDGFGNLILGSSLTGPEYAGRYIRELRGRPEIEVLTGTTVLSLKGDRSLVAVNPDGLARLQPSAVILAMGCRERSRFQALLPGYRPAGVYTAGTVQRLINMEGLMPGERVVILGSGDVGLIMARRLTLEGARVLGVFEILPRPGGLTRNVVQCLEDFGIPLYLSHTVTFIHGKKRLEGVSVAPVDKNGTPLANGERFIPCDTLLLSLGLIPENELSREAGVEIDPVTRGPVVDQDLATSVPGIYAAGNAVHVHDMVDHVTMSAARAGAGAARFAQGFSRGGQARLITGENVASVVPQLITLPSAGPVDLFVRVKTAVKDGILKVYRRERLLYRKKERMMRPPEMIHLALQTSILPDLSGGDEIRVTVEGGVMRE